MNLFNVDNDINYLLLTMGKPILVNGSNATAIIGYADNKEVEEKKIITKENIKRGDLVTINNHNYLVYNEINDKRQDTYFKAYARSCNYQIKFNFGGNVKSFYGIISTKVLDITENKYMELAEGKIQVVLQDNVDTRKIVTKQRFISMGSAFEVTGIDKSKVGLIILNCNITVFNDYDDRDNEIVDRWKYEIKHSYTLETSNTDTSIEEGKTLQFNVIAKDNNVVIENPNIVYSANNSNCNVDATGLITANNKGTSTITATFTAEDGTIKSVSITITVIEQIVVNNYTISITGSDVINVNNSEEYTAVVKNNGVVVNLPVTWILLDETLNPLSVDIAEIKNITDNTCSVYGAESGNDIVLKATLNADTSKTAILEIFIGGGW